MNIREQYEAKTGEQAMYLKGSSYYHTLRYVRWLESRLSEEIKWGHRDCTEGDCKSSGTDCPANPTGQGRPEKGGKV